MNNYLTLTFFVLISVSFSAQMHQKKGGNIGVALLGGMVMTKPDIDPSKSSNGPIMSAGVTRSFRNLLFPEINYTFFKTGYGTSVLGDASVVAHHAIGVGLPAKLNFYTMRLGKSNKGECTLLRLNILAGYYYLHQVKNQPSLGIDFPGEHALELGLGFLPQWSGGHKSRVAWSYFIDAGYRIDLNKNKAIVHSNTGWKSNGAFLRLTIVHYKTVDFLGGNAKKPAYKQKM
jgi:hypothetical protein